MNADLNIELTEGVLTLTLARPEKKNALTNEMYGALADAIERAATDAEIRVVLIQGDGDLFTAGNDMAEFAAQAVGKGPEERHVVRFLHSLSNALVPVVAAVQGKAVGIGTTMLLHCDYVLLAEGAELTTPFINLALVPEAASSLLLPQRIGHARAFEMFALGEPVPAASALAWGIANRIVPAAALRGEARRVADALAAKPQGALSAMKRLMRDAGKLVAQIDAEGAAFAQRLASPEAREAFQAFAEKRRPDFKRLAQR